MSSRSRRDTQELMRAYTLLGQRVAKIDNYLADTACMNPRMREIIGWIEAYHTYSGTQEFKDELNALKIYAEISWPRKELTDLALKVGDTNKHASFFDSKDE